MDFSTIKTQMTSSQRRIRTRFAPSPTGALHIGGLRTALVCYIIAKRFNGDFILRIEDTDQKRYVDGAVEGIIKGLDYFGITPDESPVNPGKYAPYTQSKRADIYWDALHELAERGMAYQCYMSEEHLAMLKSGDEHQINAVAQAYYQEVMFQDYSFEETLKTIKAGIKNGRWFRAWPANENVVLRPLHGAKAVWRFAAPYLGRTTWDELNGSTYSFSNQGIQDAVLMKADGLPTYHFAHVVDDNHMEISHIVRGSEWLPSTPLHLALWDAFGWEAPEYIHLPVILNPNGKGKLSKRSVSEGFFVTADQIINAGVNPNAVIVWLLQNMSLIPDNDLDWQKLMNTFTFNSLPNTKPGAISSAALNKIISRIGRNDSVDAFISRLSGTDAVDGLSEQTINVTAEFMRTRNTSGRDSYVKYMDFLQDCGIIEIDLKTDYEEQLKILGEVMMLFSENSLLQGGVEPEEMVWSVAEKYGKKALGVFRYAVTHRHVSPPVVESIKVLGGGKASERVIKYMQHIQTKLTTK